MAFLSSKPNVAALARRGKLDRLRAALRYTEPTILSDGSEGDLGVPVRAEAAEALARFDPPMVADDLGAALGDPAPEVRLAAMRALEAGGAGSDGQVNQLVSCVVARDPGAAEVTAGALKLLLAWHAEGTAELLVERLLEPGAPDPDQGHRASLELLRTTDARGEAAREAVADLLIARLQQSEDGETDADTERVFGWLGSTAVEKVLSALANGTATPAIVQAAGRLGDARAVGPVVRGLESPDPQMREASANAARTLNHTRAVPALLTATQDDEQAVRDAASAALDRMGTAAVIAGLAAVVSSRDLLATGGQGDLEGRVEDLLEANGGQELGEGESAAERRPPRQQPQSQQQQQPAAQPPPGYPPRRRSGGFLDRLLGREEP